MTSPDKKASRAATEFAAAAKKTRERLRLTQAQVAEASGLTAAAISQIESGLREPTFSTIIRIAAALKTSPNDLMGLDDTQPDPELQALYREIKKLSTDDYDKVRAFTRWLASQND